MTWYEPEDPTPREACPCCGYVTLAERGMCLICRVCFWEDDPFIRGAHHVYSTPNRMTLAEARKSFAMIGAAKAKWLGHILPFAALAHIERRPVELTDPFPPREQCPCCGYVSIPALREQWGCAACRWEDEGKPLHVTNPGMGRTLWIARARFARSGITDDRFERRPLVDSDASLPTHPCPCCDHVTLVERGAESLCPAVLLARRRSRDGARCLLGAQRLHACRRPRAICGGPKGCRRGSGRSGRSGGLRAVRAPSNSLICWSRATRSRLRGDPGAVRGRARSRARHRAARHLRAAQLAAPGRRARRAGRARAALAGYRSGESGGMADKLVGEHGLSVRRGPGASARCASTAPPRSSPGTGRGAGTPGRCTSR